MAPASASLPAGRTSLSPRCFSTSAAFDDNVDDGVFFFSSAPLRPKSSFLNLAISGEKMTVGRPWCGVFDADGAFVLAADWLESTIR